MMTYTNSSDVSYNQLPLKKRLMRDINNNHVEIERTGKPVVIARCDVILIISLQKNRATPTIPTSPHPTR